MKRESSAWGYNRATLFLGEYCIEISNRFAALENLVPEEDIKSPWETIRKNI
jgi:hypothetical protein